MVRDRDMHKTSAWLRFMRKQISTLEYTQCYIHLAPGVYGAFWIRSSYGIAPYLAKKEAAAEVVVVGGAVVVAAGVWDREFVCDGDEFVCEGEWVL